MSKARDILCPVCELRPRCELDRPTLCPIETLRELIEAEKKDLQSIVKEHKNQGASKLDIINALSEPTGYNQAISEITELFR